MHNLTSNLFKALSIFALALTSLNSYAENSREFGDYVVHYNAFRSDTISPEVAKQHDLSRASNRVLINIAVLKKEKNTTGIPTKSGVSGHASNLTGQLKNLDFNEITEDTAVYYLAETKFSDGESLKFDIKVIVDGEKRPFRISIPRKRFFTY